MLITAYREYFLLLAEGDPSPRQGQLIEQTRHLLMALVASLVNYCTEDLLPILNFEVIIITTVKLCSRGLKQLLVTPRLQSCSQECQCKIDQTYISSKGSGGAFV